MKTFHAFLSAVLTPVRAFHRARARARFARERQSFWQDFAP